MCLCALALFTVASHRPTIASNYINRNKSQHHIVLLPWLRSWCCFIFLPVIFDREIFDLSDFLLCGRHILPRVFRGFHEFSRFAAYEPYRRLCGRIIVKIVAENPLQFLRNVYGHARNEIGRFYIVIRADLINGSPRVRIIRLVCIGYIP